MTAVCFKSKNSLKTETWTNFFTDCSTDSKSCLFIKQLTSICISTILNLRKVLPEDYFEEKRFEGMTLKLLKSKKGNYLCKIEEWLEGAFEAMEKKYLKRLMLDIQDAESDMTLEVYTMTFNYNKEKEGLNPLVPYNQSGFSISNTKLSTIKLLQMCHAVTQTYSTLPSQVKLSLRLSYYENTPEDYQPRGYVASEQVDPIFPKPARSIEIGITTTQHHFFKLFNKSSLNDKFFKDLEENLENNSTLSATETDDVKKLENVSLERQTKAKRELCFDNLKTTTLVVSPERKAETLFVISEKFQPAFNQIEGNKLIQNKIENKTRTKAYKKIDVSNKVVTKADIRSQQVRCACLLSDATDMMFPCLACNFFVHAECYGILQFDSTKRIRFYCHLCHQTENNLKCHDKIIMSLKSSSDQQKLSLLRRVLRHCNMPRVYTITLKKMEKIFFSSCPKNLLNIILNKIIEIGVAVAKTKRSYEINKQILSNKLMHYFYKVQNSNQIFSQTLPYSLRNSNNFRRKNDLNEFLFNKESKHLNVVLQDFLTVNSQTSQQSCDIFC